MWPCSVYYCIVFLKIVCTCIHMFSFCILLSLSTFANVHSSIGGKYDAGPHTNWSWGFANGTIKNLASSVQSKYTAVEVLEDAVPHVTRHKCKRLDNAQPHWVEDHLPGNCFLLSYHRRECSCGERQYKRVRIQLEWRDFLCIKTSVDSETERQVRLTILRTVNKTNLYPKNQEFQF